MKFLHQAENDGRLAVKSWCGDIDDCAMEQIDELRRHPVLAEHIALMPDCHPGKGMPIGGVIAADNAIIPSAVGVDIGCGMLAVETNVPTAALADMRLRRKLQDRLKVRIPVGEGHAHNENQSWDGFEAHLDSGNSAMPDVPNTLDRKNLGTLGGGNHFVELQGSDKGYIWLMIHSGSRNLGQRIERHYSELARQINERMKLALPNKLLTFLPMDCRAGQDYFRDMTFALKYAFENRRRMMDVFKEELLNIIPACGFLREINIHHNYAACEQHFGREYFIHRKGATSTRKGEVGIIPGSMGTSSYIVKGLGNPDSFMSCSHGAGRTMSRTLANSRLKVEECDHALQGIVYERWRQARKFGRGDAKVLDLSEAPQAYKDIDAVIAAELDLIQPIVKLSPMAVLKG